MNIHVKKKENYIYSVNIDEFGQTVLKWANNVICRYTLQVEVFVHLFLLSLPVLNLFFNQYFKRFNLNLLKEPNHALLHLQLCIPLEYHRHKK